MGSIGLAAAVLLLPGILKKENWPACLLIFIGVSVGAVSRNPDTSTVFLVISPLLLSLAV
jgi:hypothetical protein